MIRYLLLGIMALGVSPRQVSQRAISESESILNRFVSAWRGREEMELRDSVTLAFDVLEGADSLHFNVLFTSDGHATLRHGRPATFLIGYATNLAVLRRIDSGELNAGTAMAAARESDRTPLQPFLPPGKQFDNQLAAIFRPLHFHFWTREWPEIVKFGARFAVPLHGATGSILWYEPGLRTGWFGIQPGMHVNADPRDQTNPFSTMVLVTKGFVRVRIGGVEARVSAGEMLMVPAGTRHELWAEKTDPGGEGFLVMFGPKA